MRVFLTFDIEVWCGSWNNIDDVLPNAFHRYIYGGAKSGNHALPKILETLGRYNLQGVFLVEPLFSTRAGLRYLTDVIRLLIDARQEIQMHMHPAWIDEARPPIMKSALTKRGSMSSYSLDEQTELISIGVDLLQQAGAPRPVAFRAGSFAANRNTLRALAANNMTYDLSSNACFPGSMPDIHANNSEMNDVSYLEGIYEYPMSVFVDGLGSLRHAQVGACASNELIQAMEDAHAIGRQDFVILSHNFEALKINTGELDTIVARRFETLCRYLSTHTIEMPTSGFGELSPHLPETETRLPKVSMMATVQRYGEQLLRRF